MAHRTMVDPALQERVPEPRLWSHLDPDDSRRHGQSDDQWVVTCTYLCTYCCTPVFVRANPSAWNAPPCLVHLKNNYSYWSKSTNLKKIDSSFKF